MSKFYAFSSCTLSSAGSLLVVVVAVVVVGCTVSFSLTLLRCFRFVRMAMQLWSYLQVSMNAVVGCKKIHNTR